MKALVFSRNSWHFWVANEWGGLSRYEEDFCHYVRCVLWGLIKLAALATLGGAVIYALGDWLGWTIACLVQWQIVDPSIPAVLLNITFGVCAACVAVGFFLYGLDRYGTYRHEKAYARRQLGGEPPQPGFLAMAYRSLKNKTCFRVEFK